MANTTTRKTRIRHRLQETARQLARFVSLSGTTTYMLEALGIRTAVEDNGVSNSDDEELLHSSECLLTSSAAIYPPLLLLVQLVQRPLRHPEYHPLRCLGHHLRLQSPGAVTGITPSFPLCQESTTWTFL